MKAFAPEQQNTAANQGVTAPTEGFHTLPRRQVVLTMVGVMLAMLLSALDQTIVGTAMPRIIADLKGFEHYAWVVTAYMVSSTTAAPIVGKLTDLYSQKWLYLIGIVIFLFGSVLCGLSQTMTQLIVFRGLQGIGAGVMMANSFTVIGHLFAPSERGKYIGFVTAMFGLASVVGPTAGGYITDNLSWQWVFYVNLPLGLTVVAVFLFFFPHVEPVGKHQEIDFAGAGTLILSIVPLLLALSWAGKQFPWGSLEIVGLLSLTAVAAALFLYVENRAREPIIPLQLFNNPIYAVSVLVIFLSGIGMFGTILFIPLFVQGVLGASATVSGNVLTPMMLSIVVSSIISGQVLSRVGGKYRIQALFGLGALSFGMYLLTGMGLDTQNSTVIRNSVITGLGLGVTMPLFTIAVQNSVPYRMLGVSTASTQFFRAIGGTVGMAILGTVMTNRFTTQFEQRLLEQSGSAIPASQLSALLANPEALVSPQAKEQLGLVVSQLHLADGAQVEQVLSLMRQALALSIHDVFVVGMFFSIAALVACVFLKEVPLRKIH